jgi:hypothetical protein
MPSSIRARFACAFLVASLAPAKASAEPFSTLAREAHEVTRELGALAAPLLASCDALVGRSRELCDANLGRARAEVEGRMLLSSVPAEGLVEIGPYDPGAGGFRVRVPGFQLIGAQGVVSTRPRSGGVLPAHQLAESFVAIAPAEAAAFVARNAPERLRLRLVFRFGRTWQDEGAPRPEEQRGILVELRAVQVYNESSGEVLLDSTEHRTLPPAPSTLEARRLLYGHGRAREVLWRTPDGAQVLFHVRVDRSEQGAIAPAVLCTRGADTRELVRFDDLDSEASVDLLPHGELGALLVITESRTRRGHVGRGQVLLLRWDAAAARIDVRARWRGANDETPPAWVRDPNAEVPETPAEGPT